MIVSLGKKVLVGEIKGYPVMIHTVQQRCLRSDSDTASSKNFQIPPILPDPGMCWSYRTPKVQVL